MNKTSQWNPPEEPKDFMEWLKKWHPKWIKASDTDTLRHMLTTSDGLGTKMKIKALDTLLDMK